MMMYDDMAEAHKTINGVYTKLNVLSVTTENNKEYADMCVELSYALDIIEGFMDYLE